MALPVDGSPMLEGHPDNGKEQGKLWLNEADMVSEDHGEELRYSSPPQSVDCSTSSSGNEVGNGDQDFKSRFRVDQVLGSNIKFLWGIGVLEQALKLLESTVDQLGSSDGSLSIVVLADVASQLLEILPQNFKYIQDIGVAQKPKEDMAPYTSPEFPSGLHKQEEAILRPEKSRPIGTLQHHQVGLEEDRASLTSSRARTTTKKVDAAKEDDPPSKPSHQVGLKEDAAHVTSVTGINGKRTKDSDAEEQPPAKRSRHTVAGEELPTKRTRDSVLSFPYQKTEYEDPFVVPPVLSLSPLTSCEDPGLSSPVLSPFCKMACKSPVLSSPVLSPSTLTHYEDPILSPSVFSLPPRMLYEDPILSPCVFSPSSSTHCENSTLSSLDFCFWMETEGATEEEAIPSTSTGITARESSRHVWFRPHYVLSSDSD